MKVLVYQFHTDLGKEKNFSSGKHKNNYGNYWEYSKKSVEKYCETYGFDYVFKNPKKDEYKPFAFNCQAFDKYFMLDNYSNYYDYLIWLDSDILIKPNAKNIILEHKHHFNEGCQILARLPQGEKYLYEDTMSATGHINSGVLVFKTKHLNNNFSNAHCARNHSFPQLSNVVDRFNKGYWYQYWEEKFKDDVVLRTNGSIVEEDILYKAIITYGIRLGALHRKWNYDVEIMNEDYDKSYFIHYTHHAKTYMKRDYERIYG